MSRGAQLLLTALVLAVAAAGYYWYRENIEWVDEEIFSGFTGEARRNELLAAQRMLERLGAEVSSQPSLLAADALPTTQRSVILVTGTRRTLSRQRHQQLLAWIESGGHLIAGVAIPSSEELYPDDEDVTDEDIEAAYAGATERAVRQDPLLQRSGTRPLRLEPDPDAPAAGEPVWVDLPNAHDFLLVDFFQERGLAPAPEADLTVAGEYGIHLLSMPLGAGRLTLLSDTYPFTNTGLAEFDHAAALRYLAELDDAPAGAAAGDDAPLAGLSVLLVHGDDMESLGEWLWRHARPVVIAALLLVLAWLLLGLQRFGPLLLNPPPHRRRISEHIRAAGEFYWRHGQGDGLYDAVRTRLLRRIEARHPSLTRLEADEQSAGIAEITNLPSAELELALQRPPANDPDRFTRQIQILEAMRKRL